MLKSFRTYQLAKEFYKDCVNIKADTYLKDQLLRAALSVVNNLAEGSAKPTAKDRRRIYAISLGSYRECEAMLDLLELQETIEKHDKLGASLYKLSHFIL
jgi:four helix bundle protein